MSITLSQNANASFPDRPASTGTGLLVSAQPGGDGQYLEHDLGQTPTTLHVRLLINPATMTGPRITLLRGVDVNNQETFSLIHRPDDRTVTADLANLASMAINLPQALDWHCVELSIDTLAGTATLEHNGLNVGHASGNFTSLNTQRVRVGGMIKHVHIQGDLYLDELVIATDAIGPVMIEPDSSHANDPARWLVIYNIADPDAEAWANHYRAARNIPYANLLGLDLPTTETISASQYADLVLTVNDYLGRHHLDTQIMGVVLGYRVPGYVDTTGAGSIEAVASLMHTHSTAALGTLGNPLAVDGMPTRPTFDLLAGLRLTARLDAPTLADAIAQIDRATTLIDQGLGDGSDSTLFFDPLAGSGSAHAGTTTLMVNWANSLDRQATRLPFQVSGPLDSTTAQAFTTISQDGFFWGWDDPSPSVGFFGSPAGTRVLCAQLGLNPISAPTLRSASPSHWIDTARDAGYAAMLGVASPYSASATPLPGPFFEALRQGWSLGEACFVALPLLREGVFLAGDPLMTIALPQAGWNVHGPIAELEQLDPDQPALRLRADALNTTSLTPPVSDQESIYALEPVDAQGRSAGSWTATRTLSIAGQPASPPMKPIWPHRIAWPVPIEAGQSVLRLLWDRPLSQTRITHIDLLAEVDQHASAVVAQPLISPAQSRIEVLQPLPGQQARYRWRLRTTDGAEHLTPWSAYVGPTDDGNVALTLLETPS